MKKLYSAKRHYEVYALDAAQLELLRQNGYKTPTAEEIIADAGAGKIEPPEGARAYIEFDYTYGEFLVRSKTQVLKRQEVGKFTGEILQAAMLCRLLESADPDSRSGKAEAEPSELAEAVKNALIKAAEKSRKTVEAET